MKTINKKLLKQGYYWECDDLYETLPETLPISNYSEYTLKKDTKYSDILSEYNIIPEKSFKEAATIAANAIPHIKNDEYKIIFFLNNSIPCRLRVWRDGDGKLDLRVYRVDPDDSWRAGVGVLVSTLETLQQDPLSSDTLALAIQTCKDNGLEVFKKM